MTTLNQMRNGVGGQVPRFRSERTVCSVSVPGGHYKVLQIVFQKRDGSVFVTFPYYQHRIGFVSLATVPSGPPGEGVQVDLKPGGRVTSHLVKYAHHPDGEAHFSQTGKVLTHVRRTAVALDRAGGHLFTVHVSGYEQFRAVTAAEGRQGPTHERTLLNFSLIPERPTAIKIVGRLYTNESLAFEGSPPSGPGPVPTVDESGVQRWAFLVSPLEGWPGDHRILMLTAEEWMASDVRSEPHVSLVGGFDPPEIARDPGKPTTVLALSYPIDSAEDLRQELATIDL